MSFDKIFDLTAGVYFNFFNSTISPWAPLAICCPFSLVGLVHVRFCSVWYQPVAVGAGSFVGPVGGLLGFESQLGGYR